MFHLFMLAIPTKTELNTYCPACIHVSIEYPFYTTLLRLLFFQKTLTVDLFGILILLCSLSSVDN